MRAFSRANWGTIVTSNANKQGALRYWAKAKDLIWPYGYQARAN
jgi:hypothetical protein